METKLNNNDKNNDDTSHFKQFNIDYSKNMEQEEELEILK